MKICIVAGARPNFIKVAPIIRAVEKAKARGRNISYSLIYTGCEDDKTIEQSLFDDLQMPKPDVYLAVNSDSLNEITGSVIYAFERYLKDNHTDVVIVVDDLASTMAAAIVAKKQGVKLAHLVAGTRSFDINMPKEVNRLVIDGLSDLLFTAGIGSNSIVSREGAHQSKVYMVGNILMDTLRFNMPRFKRPQILDEMSIEERQYIVFTLNRRALIADRSNLEKMLKGLLLKAQGIPVIAPLRGMARKVVGEIMTGCKGLVMTEPLPYLEFGYLTSHAMGIVTDSGNVAEEATFNNVPCITLNSYTEHIETVRKGSNVLVGEDAEQLMTAVGKMVGGDWKKSTLPDRWDGRSAERIVQILLDMKQ